MNTGLILALLLGLLGTLAPAAGDSPSDYELSHSGSNRTQD
jgi:hypothetical protein